MKNRYKICGDDLIIFIDRKNGDVVEVYVSAEDFEKLNSLDRKWYATKNKGMNSFYINTNLQSQWGDKKHISVSLHRFIMDAPKDAVVDHIDGNPLNNRRSNLRIGTHSDNSQNQTRIRMDNTSGYRGVSWCKYHSKWQAYISLKGKKKHIGYFDDVIEAALASSQARKKIMPFSDESLLNEVS